MTTYKLNEANPDKKILLIEKGDGLDEYSEQQQQLGNTTYRNSFNWQNVSGFGYGGTLGTDKPLSLGKGVGGGTLHFGLQYIDNIVDKSAQMYKNWRGDNGGSNYFNIVENLLSPHEYDYSTESSTLGDSYINLKNEINKTNNDGGKKYSDVDWYNNKIYSNTPTGYFSANRIVVGDILYDNGSIKDNITILTNTEVNNLVFNTNNTTIEYCTDSSGNNYYGNKFILCLGAIQTPVLLLKSDVGPNKTIDLPVGEKLYDHAGMVTIYKKETTTTTTTPPDSTLYYSDSDITNIRALSGVGDSNFKIFDTTSNDEGYENLDSSSYNSSSSPKKMYRIFRHSKLSDSQIQQAVSGIRPTGNSSISLSTSQCFYYVYDMGNFWNGGGHWISLFTKPKDLTSTLLGRHGSQYGYRLFPDGSNNSSTSRNCRLRGIYKDSLGESTVTQETTELSDLGFKTMEVLQHIQTRHSDLEWQTYYSIIPGYNSRLILANAHSKHINDKGTITLNDNNEPIVTLNHFEGDSNGKSASELKNYIIDSMQKNHEILTSSDLGYKLDMGGLDITINAYALAAIEDPNNGYQSIYHYHGSCQEGEVVDSDHKVNNVNNLYIGDISILKEPWGGSTSVPALITGYITAEKILESESE